VKEEVRKKTGIRTEGELERERWIVVYEKSDDNRFLFFVSLCLFLSISRSYSREKKESFFG
jgi:hypothetical protein